MLPTCCLRPAVAFILTTALFVSGRGARGNEPGFRLRSTLDNARLRFERTGQGRVAFLGGSITEMEGYRPRVMAALQRRFPNTRFDFVNAGVSSTCSTTGAFRLAHDVLSRGRIDLLLFEFAVNDDQDAHHTRQECILGVEGIVRHALASNPEMDLVMLYFLNADMNQTLQEGRIPPTIKAHDEVAQHYQISTVNIARYVGQQIGGRLLTWKQYGGVHPAPLGNDLAAGLVERLFEAAWQRPLSEAAQLVPHPLPQPLDRFNYEHGRMLPLAEAQVMTGWQVKVPDWASIPGACRARFKEQPLLCAETIPAELTQAFEGTAVGAYVLAGPDAGTLIARIDGGPPREVDLYHHFSAGLHYPRTVLFADELRPGRHSLVLTLKPPSADRPQARAARLIGIVAN